MILVNTDNNILEYIGNFDEIPTGYIDVTDNYIGNVENLNLERYIYEWNGVDDFTIFDDKLENLYDEIESEVGGGSSINFPLWNSVSVSKSDINIFYTNSPESRLYKNDGGTPSPNNCLNFISYSNSRVTISNSSNYNFSDTFSIEFWIKRDSNTLDWKEILRKNNVFELGFAGNKQLYFEMGNYFVPISQLTNNDWHHIVLVCNPTIGNGNDYLKIYYNSSLVNTSYFWHPGDNVNDILINRQRNQFSIDNLVFWQKELSQTEITQAFNNGSGRDYGIGTTGIVGLWKSNETSGNVLNDEINNNNGSIAGIENTDFEWTTGVVGSLVSRGIVLNFFENNTNEEIFFNILIPKNYKQNTALKPSIHWVGDNDGGSGDSVDWYLEYTISNVGDLFSDTTKITTNNIKNNEGEDISAISQDQHLISIFPDIVHTNLENSSVLICRLYRDGFNDTFNGDAGFLKFELNYQVDKIGLETIYGL